MQVPTKLDPPQVLLQVVLPLKSQPASKDWGAESLVRRAEVDLATLRNLINSFKSDK